MPESTSRSQSLPDDVKESSSIDRNSIEEDLN